MSRTAHQMQKRGEQRIEDFQNKMVDTAREQMRDEY